MIKLKEIFVMKKILSLFFALVTVCVMFMFVSTSASAEISPTAETFTHHEHGKETTTYVRYVTRPKKNTTRPGGTVTHPYRRDESTTKNVPGGKVTTTRKKATTNPFIEYVTDEDGSTVTDVNGKVVTKKPNVTSDTSNESPNTAASGSVKSLVLSITAISVIAVVSLKKKKEISE